MTETATGVRRLRSIPGGKGASANGAQRKPSRSVLDEVGSEATPEWHLDDVGNAERLAHYYGKGLRYVPAWGMFLTYEKDSYWKIDTGRIRVTRLAKQTANKIKDEAVYELTHQEKKRVYKWMTSTRSRPRLEAMIKLVESEKKIAVDHTALNQDPYLLNVANGTLDLKLLKTSTDPLRPHDPNDLITKILPVEYKPRARCPRWEKFLKQVMPDKDVRRFLQKYLGYSLTGNVGARLFVVLYGYGRNGKSVLIDTIQEVMGAYACTAPPALLMSKENNTHPTELASLYGVRLAGCSETKKGRTFDEELVKRITGKDRISARRMREDFWEFKPTHKILLATNHKPKVRDTTDSFWDRIVLIPFAVRITESMIDHDLAEKLQDEELEGILTWLVEGCRLWLKEGLKQPETVKAATQQYRDEQDIVGRFFNECCTFEKNAWQSTNEIMRRNKLWAQRLNFFQSGINDLTEALRTHGCVPHTGRAGRGWRGVRLIDDK